MRLPGCRHGPANYNRTLRAHFLEHLRWVGLHPREQRLQFQEFEPMTVVILQKRFLLSLGSPRSELSRKERQQNQRQAQILSLEWLAHANTPFPEKYFTTMNG